MCRCKYPKSIKRNGINIIEDEEGERCYKITFDISDEGSNILVISRAPKGLEGNSCNSIYKIIVKFLNKNKDEFKGIKKLTIVNLFTVYEYSKNYLYEEYILKGKEYIEGNEGILHNDEIIRNEIHDADYIIAAWGEPVDGLGEIYVSRVKLILKSLRHEIMNSTKKKQIIKVGDTSKNGYPKHCLAWCYKDKLESLFE